MYSTYIQPFIDYIQNGEVMNNDFAVAGILSAAAYTVLGYLQPLPGFIWGRLYRTIFYQVTIEQSDELYALINRYVAYKYPDKLRNTEAFLKERFADWEEYDDNSKKTGKINYRHFSDFIVVFRDYRFIVIEKEREKLDNAENMTMAYLGRINISGIFAKKAIKKLVKDSLSMLPDKDKGKVKKYVYEHHWYTTYAYTNKNVDSIFFPEKESILRKIDRFQKSRDFYRSRGIDWYLGILLHGNPGSGKTVFAKAIAEYTNRDLYVLDIAGMSNESFKAAFNSIGSNAVLIIDDADVAIPTKRNIGETSSKKKGKEKDTKKDTGIHLSTLLSSMDGTMSRSDIIIIMTTNVIEKFDEAILRKGRLDIIEKISYPNKDSVVQYLAIFN